MERRAVNLLLPVEHFDLLSCIAEVTESSTSDVIRDAIERYIERCQSGEYGAVVAAKLREEPAPSRTPPRPLFRG